MKKITLLFYLMLFINNLYAQNCLTTAQINPSLIGKTYWVSGKVVQVNYHTDMTGNPTFLNLDKPYPDCPLEIVVLDEYLKNFSSPLKQLFLNKSIKVKGKIALVDGIFQIQVKHPRQIRVQE